MLNASFAAIDEADVPIIRAWLASLAERREELRESYRQQGTRHELFFLVRAPRPVLVLISELEDVERGSFTFLRSRLPLDLEFKSLVQTVSNGEMLGAELLFDSSTLVDRPSRRGPPGPEGPEDRKGRKDGDPAGA